MPIARFPNEVRKPMPGLVAPMVIVTALVPRLLEEKKPVPDVPAAPATGDSENPED